MSKIDPGTSEDPQPPVRGPVRVLASVIVVGLCLGIPIGVGLAIDLTLRNGEHFDFNVAVLAAHLSGLYSLLTIAGLFVASAGLMLVGRRPEPRLLVALGVCFYVVLNSLLRFNPTIQPASVVPHITLVGIFDLIVIATATVAIGLGIVARSRSRGVLLVGSGIALIAALWLVNSLNERPLRRDLATLVPEILESTGDPAPPPAAERFENARLIVLGFDGLSWEVLLPLLRRGELPGFASLLHGASYGYLDTLSFTISPVVWETISTGQLPERHGIGYHGHFDFPGVDWRVRRLPAFPLASSPMGLRRLLVALAARGAPWSQVVAASSDAKVARFWEIVSRANTSIGVFDWLNTEPATPVAGFSRGLYRSLPPFDYPVDLEGDFELPEAQPPSNGVQDRFAANRPKQTALYRHFVDLALDASPEVLMYYTHYGDGSNHLFWRDETYGERFFLSGLSHPEVDPGTNISSAHRLLDEVLLDVLARKPDDATIIVVSDHGFDYRGYEHDNRPPGVWIGRGDGIRPGLVEGISVLDVTPTLLHELGLPVADDMQGSPIPIAIPGGRLDRPVDRVATYGPAATTLAEGVDDEGLDEYMEYLRSLGYVD